MQGVAGGIETMPAFYEVQTFRQSWRNPGWPYRLVLSRDSAIPDHARNGGKQGNALVAAQMFHQIGRKPTPRSTVDQTVQMSPPLVEERIVRPFTIEGHAAMRRHLLVASGLGRPIAHRCNRLRRAERASLCPAGFFILHVVVNGNSEVPGRGGRV